MGKYQMLRRQAREARGYINQGRQGGRDLNQMREKALWLPGEMVSGSRNCSVNSRTERHLREL